MGWTWIDGFTRADVIQDVTRTHTNSEGTRQWTTLAKCVRGPNLWTVMAVTEVSTGKELDRFILLFLLNRDRTGAGYKDISEEMGPCEVNCPLGYLEMVPCPDAEYAKNWRARVMQYHAQYRKTLVVGKTYELLHCKGIKTARIVNLRPLRGVADNGVTYRLSKRIIGEEVKNVAKSFDLGRLVATPGAMEALQDSNEEPSKFLHRHFKNDWGEVCDDDKKLNDEALELGNRLLSAYTTSKGVKLWVITEAVGDNGKREATTILLPEEY